MTDAGGGVRLVCPLCRVLASDGPPPAPSRCPGCAARYEGGGDRPGEACASALAALGIPGDGERLARALFTEDCADRGVAITSDQRDGFYCWWLFVGEGADALVARLAGDAPDAQDR